ncbi:UDP-N-acetyl-D-glucosamine 2-epimerase, UDP-hydrolysing [candidate division WOR-1 bacterium RIFOXYA12_FULL_43_27]|uniref:UDP-N-acetyl-D-glucosamine 2-epimerase, UDP-hydrolysing n=1 Tax=candidate division WOR-1 bacterium RIFOXYC2_FULL_46_14 TaxID=1802587 RepID=A0A1F4U3I5_UNCSA|nr:MAG: UDP-N-acetyl-D-glucosamine 2-epimerase, UDP-hydrolysing [candidate division WOR-1 bacterium RIFOXYA12_FULL_43_27]OGC20237.1 MAG: UDP-N-acetyl-D-glucosamine 2-epimerase, UDP-hydrolysing [candidate division WOR-1 bacterium RIFOXYB2_FULL_46_45]OGC32024.1 MAG: UDP-N-acetyl-D-glucosamine 2-epimerase, UDP-hydrolysing [candidate division WOR-1 bacterium RIFOXYA2_FULL_46_56]OGC39427.1 MAG: UDP-N-acetyl-D-glucosamine 2-epimerase, UDP-hydrolysing [candidate division WOR-1 bacterium RIFOXYC2_FULL_4
MNKNICVITGTRAEYGVLKPLLSEIGKNRNLNLQLVVMGMHLMREFGYSIDEIKKDGFKISAVVNNAYKEDSKSAMVVSLGKEMGALPSIFKKLNPEIVVTIGDRGEMLVAAMVAKVLGISVAHIHGGDVSGNVDDLFRHALTKISDFHFPATKKSKERILGFGEHPKYVWRVGALGLDSILKPGAFENKYGIDFSSRYILVVQHPVVSESGQAKQQAVQTLEAVKETGMKAIVVYPNADAGGRKIIEVIKEYEGVQGFKIFKNLPHDIFLFIMSNAAVMVGNSSSGIIEAASYKVPVVNIGSRQKGRERGSNVINVGHDKKAIKRAINRALFDKGFRKKLANVKNPYGDGRTARKIVKILQRVGKNELKIR